jgi:isoleucyl-tRNA synthetase
MRDEPRCGVLVEELIAVRAAVNKRARSAARAGEMRGSLDATVTLYCDERWRQLGASATSCASCSSPPGPLAPLARRRPEAAATEHEGLRLW